MFDRFAAEQELAERMLSKRSDATAADAGHPTAFAPCSELLQLQARKETGLWSMTLTIQLPDKLEAALKVEANAHGVSPAGYVRDILERELASSLEKQVSGPPFKTGWGLLAKFGPAPSAEEIDANRAEMFQHFAED